MMYLFLVLLIKKLIFIKFSFLPNTHDSFYKNKNSLYEEALNNNFIEFLLFFHTKPIGTIIRDKLSLIRFNNIKFIF